MANIVPRKNDPLTPIRVSRRLAREIQHVDGAAEVELLKLDRQTQIGTQRARSIARVGTRAMEAQAIVTMTERMIVQDMEPGAINAISFLSKKVTMGLGEVIDRTIDEVVR